MNEDIVYVQVHTGHMFRHHGSQQGCRTETKGEESDTHMLGIGIGIILTT